MNNNRGRRNREKKWRQPPLQSSSDRKGIIDDIFADMMDMRKGWQKRLAIYHQITNGSGVRKSEVDRSAEVAEVAQEIFGGSYFCWGDSRIEQDVGDGECPTIE